MLAMKATAHLEYYLGATQGEQDGEIDLVNFDPPLRIFYSISSIDSCKYCILL